MDTISWLSCRRDYESAYDNESLYRKWGRNISKNQMSGISLKSKEDGISLKSEEDGISLKSEEDPRCTLAKHLTMFESPALLQVFDVYCAKDGTVDMVTEPLWVCSTQEKPVKPEKAEKRKKRGKRDNSEKHEKSEKRSEAPITLDTMIKTFDRNYFIERRASSDKFVFSTNLKCFLRETIKLSKRSVFIKLSAENILYTAKGEFKSYDLRSNRDTLSDSLKDFQNMLNQLVDVQKGNRLEPSEEVLDFLQHLQIEYDKVTQIKYDNVTQNLHRHPAVLETGEKLKLLLRAHTCMLEDKMPLVDGSNFCDWETKIKKYTHLKQVFQNTARTNLQPTTRTNPAITTPTNFLSDLVKHIRNVSVHVNDYVKTNEQGQGDFSPLSSHKNGRATYTDHDVERTFEHLFPSLATRLHNVVRYSMLDKWGPF